MRTAIFTLFGVVTLCAALWMADDAQAQNAGVPAFILRQVGSNVWAAIDNPAARGVASSNSGFVIGNDGVAVIDSFTSADAATELLADIRQRTQLPIKFVINTHHHPDHVAGNGVFADAGATILAHRNVRTWIHAENLRLVDDKTPPDIKAWLQGLTSPAVIYADGVDLYLGERQLQVRFFPGHTGGDSVVFVPDARVAFAGDLLWRNMLPNTVDSTTLAWIATLNTLAKGNAQYTFIPGDGDVGTHETLWHCATTLARCACRWGTRSVKASPAVRLSTQCCPPCGRTTDNGTTSCFSPNRTSVKWKQNCAAGSASPNPDLLVRCAEEEPVLRRDRRRNRLRADPVASVLEANGAHHVDGQRTVDPSSQRTSVIDRQIVAARKYRDAGAGGCGAIEDEIGQRSARMRRDDEIVLGQRHRLQRRLHEDDASGQSRPDMDQDLVQLLARRRLLRIDAERLRRRVVQDQENVGEQTVAGSNVDDASAAKHAADAPCHFPRLVQFLAWQTSCVTDGPRQAVEQRGAGKPLQIVIGQATLG